jgi:DNA-binding NarL/FixJ family response regulator
VAGGICCDLIFACEHVHDFDRAGQWCLSTGESARHASHPALFGVCRAHYASVLVHRGRWEEAEEELEAAAGLFERSGRGMAYEAVLRLAELRRRQGRYEEAERLCETVVWHPRAQLCLAAAAFDQNRLDDAVRCLEAHLRALPSSDRLGRTAGLALAVKVRTAASDADGARAAAHELAESTQSAGTVSLLALRDAALAQLDAQAGNSEAARRRLEDAAAAWAQAGMPFEEAETRLALAQHARGRADAAHERSRAAALLRALGCEERAERAEEAERSESLTPREIEVLRLVGDGLSDDEIAERLVVSPHTVHRHVANIRTKLRESSRAAAAAHAARAGLI